MDMVFRDDECRLRADHAPANFCTIKHMAQNLVRRAPGKNSLRLKQKPQPGMKNSSPHSSQVEQIHPIPLPRPHARIGPGTRCTNPLAPGLRENLRLGWAQDPAQAGGYKTKGLIGLAWTAPYCHEGSVAVGLDASRISGATGPRRILGDTLTAPYLRRQGTSRGWSKPTYESPRATRAPGENCTAIYKP